MSISRSDAKATHAQVKQAMTVLAETLGMTLGTKCSYGQGAINVTLTLSPKGEDGIPADYSAKCRMFGLTPESFGATFRSNGKNFTICGINMRARRYPINATEEGTGKTYKFNDESVVNALKRAELSACIAA